MAWVHSTLIKKILSDWDVEQFWRPAVDIREVEGIKINRGPQQSLNADNPWLNVIITHSNVFFPHWIYRKRNRVKYCDKSRYQRGVYKRARLMAFTFVGVRYKIVLWKTLQQCRISILYCVRIKISLTVISHWSMFTSNCRWQRRLAVRYNVGFLGKKMAAPIQN